MIEINIGKSLINLNYERDNAFLKLKYSFIIYAFFFVLTKNSFFEKKNKNPK